FGDYRCSSRSATVARAPKQSDAIIGSETSCEKSFFTAETLWTAETHPRSSLASTVLSTVGRPQQSGLGVVMKSKWHRSLHADCQLLFAGDRHAAKVSLFGKKSAPSLIGRFLSCFRSGIQRGLG